MVTIMVRETFFRRIQVTVCENPTPGTWGDYQLLLHEYRNLDPTYGRTDFEQMLFNYKYLKDMELGYGPLWCVYCGKEELVIYHWQEKGDRRDMATADHFLPKSKYPELVADRKNLRVACYHCNSKKGSEEWEENYPYD